MNNKKFIITKNKNTAEELKHFGFNLLSESNGTFIFVNDRKLVFSNLEDISYTDKLFF